MRITLSYQVSKDIMTFTQHQRRGVASIFDLSCHRRETESYRRPAFSRGQCPGQVIEAFYESICRMQLPTFHSSNSSVATD